MGSATLEQMTPLARDRALRLEMRAEGNLHPALFSNDRHYEVVACCRGRKHEKYGGVRERPLLKAPFPVSLAPKVLKQLSDGALGLLMDPQNRERPLVRTIVREIFSSALLKPAMQFLLPSFFNKASSKQCAPVLPSSVSPPPLLSRT